MLPLEIKKNIYWVGGIDWDLRNFHGYLTQRGSSYNAYLIVGEKNILIDNVKLPLFNQLLTRIEKIIDPRKIDFLIQNHVEMDHSGSLPELMKLNPNATIITSPNGEKGIKSHYAEAAPFTDAGQAETENSEAKGWKMKVVRNGETIKLGEKTFQFVLTPMVHWPDNMVTYTPEDRILFSNDAFGQHISSFERFDDEYPYDTIIEEASKYYANIVLPYSAQVQKILPAVEEINPQIIAPSHGLIWRKYLPEIFRHYKKWSGNETDKKAVIVYDTMWKSTEKIAYAILKGFENSGIPVEMRNLQANHISDVMAALLSAKYICIGSPTLNNSILPSIAAFLTYLKGLSPKKRIGIAFGSYGWGGQSVQLIETFLKECTFEMLPSVKVQYVPNEDILDDITTQIESYLKE